MPAPWHVSKGFSLIQVSILLAAGALVLASNLPGRDAGDYNQKVLDTLYKLDKVEAAMQGFMAAHGRRPCPADGQYDVNAQAFGLEAGALTPNAPLTECSGGSPAAPMGPDAGTGNVYMGTIPTKTLSLPDDYAYDAWGRRFSYVVDKRATYNAACYGMSTAGTPGGVVVQYKDTSGAVVETENTLYAYISHGPDAHGAWPPQGSSVAGRINRASTDADTLTNAGVNASFTYSTAIFTGTRVRHDRTTGFDDLVYYHRDTASTCCIGDACRLFDPGAFSVEGGAANDLSGSHTTFIDINGDGLDDLVTAAPNADPGGRINAGSVFITFGTRSIITQPVSVASLNGSNGFAVHGAAAGDHLGSALAAGDMNGDGIQDLAIGAPDAATDTGEVNVVFGGTGVWPAGFTVTGLAGSTGTNGTNGIRLNGAAAGDRAGHALVMGDIDADTIHDLAIGSPGTDSGRGAVHVAFGSSSSWSAATPVSLSALAGTTGINGTDGTRIDGAVGSTEGLGSALSSCDVTGDGIHDLIMGAPHAWVLTRSLAGRVYVLFGKTTPWAASFNATSLNGTTGFVNNGAAADHQAGYALACGDISGDGLPDMVISAPFSDVSGTLNGSVYVEYGRKTAFPATVELSSLRYYNDGYRLDGGNGEQAGMSVAMGGDLNGDGVEDLLIGAPKKAPGGKLDAGGAYVYFGTDSGMMSTNSLTALNGTTGVIIEGANPGDAAGTTVASGNINGEPQHAVIIGAPNVTAGGNSNAGKTYLIQGTPDWTATQSLTTVP